MPPAQTVARAAAFATQSSLACLPAMLAATRKLGVRESTADFVLPLAVAIFRGTSPAMNMGVAIYAAYLTGTPLSPFVLAVGVLVVVGGRYLLRPIFRFVARTDSVEVSTATALLVVRPTELFMRSFWPFIRLLNGMGRAVVRAVEAKEPYVMSHPDHAPLVERRHQAIIAAHREPAQPGYAPNVAGLGFQIGRAHV